MADVGNGRRPWRARPEFCVRPSMTKPMSLYDPRHRPLLPIAWANICLPFPPLPPSFPFPPGTPAHDRRRRSVSVVRSSSLASFASAGRDAAPTGPATQAAAPAAHASTRTAATAARPAAGGGLVLPLLGSPARAALPPARLRVDHGWRIVTEGAPTRASLAARRDLELLFIGLPRATCCKVCTGEVGGGVVLFTCRQS